MSVWNEISEKFSIPVEELWLMPDILAHSLVTWMESSEKHWENHTEALVMTWLRWYMWCLMAGRPGGNSSLWPSIQTTLEGEATMGHLVQIVSELAKAAKADPIAKVIEDGRLESGRTLMDVYEKEFAHRRNGTAHGPSRQLAPEVREQQLRDSRPKCTGYLVEWIRYLWKMLPCMAIHRQIGTIGKNNRLRVGIQSFFPGLAFNEASFELAPFERSQTGENRDLIVILFTGEGRDSFRKRARWAYDFINDGMSKNEEFLFNRLVYAQDVWESTFQPPLDQSIIRRHLQPVIDRHPTTRRLRVANGLRIGSSDKPLKVTVEYPTPDKPVEFDCESGDGHLHFDMLWQQVFRGPALDVELARPQFSDIPTPPRFTAKADMRVHVIDHEQLFLVSDKRAPGLPVSLLRIIDSDKVQRIPELFRKLRRVRHEILAPAMTCGYLERDNARRDGYLTFDIGECSKLADLNPSNYNSYFRVLENAIAQIVDALLDLADPADEQLCKFHYPLTLDNVVWINTGGAIENGDVRVLPMLSTIYDEPRKESDVLKELCMFIADLNAVVQNRNTQHVKHPLSTEMSDWCSVVNSADEMLQFMKSDGQPRGFKDLLRICAVLRNHPALHVHREVFCHESNVAVQLTKARKELKRQEWFLEWLRAISADVSRKVFRKPGKSPIKFDDSAPEDFVNSCTHTVASLLERDRFLGTQRDPWLTPLGGEIVKGINSVKFSRYQAARLEFLKGEISKYMDLAERRNKLAQQFILGAVLWLGTALVFSVVILCVLWWLCPDVCVMPRIPD